MPSCYKARLSPAEWEGKGVGGSVPGGVSWWQAAGPITKQMVELQRKRNCSVFLKYCSLSFLPDSATLLWEEVSFSLLESNRVDLSGWNSSCLLSFIYCNSLQIFWLLRPKIPNIIVIWDFFVPSICQSYLSKPLSFFPFFLKKDGLHIA